VDAKDGSVDDRVLEMETSQIVSDTDSIGDGEEPVIPVAYPVVQLVERFSNPKPLRTRRNFRGTHNDALAKMVGCIPNKFEASSDGWLTSKRQLSHPTSKNSSDSDLLSASVTDSSSMCRIQSWTPKDT
jgi:hypothetical protein